MNTSKDRLLWGVLLRKITENVLKESFVRLEVEYLFLVHFHRRLLQIGESDWLNRHCLYDDRQRFHALCPSLESKVSFNFFLSITQMSLFYDFKP